MFPPSLAIAFLVARTTQAPPASQAPAATPPPVATQRTLAGVALGAPLPDAVVHDPAIKQFPNPLGKGTISKWHRNGAGGTVTVVTNADGVATRIEFVADDKEYSDTVDLPCAPNFPLADSHVNLDVAAEHAGCKTLDISTYRVPDGSIFSAQFGGAVPDGSLLEAIWYRADGA